MQSTNYALFTHESVCALLPQSRLNEIKRGVAVRMDTFNLKSLEKSKNTIPTVVTIMGIACMIGAMLFQKALPNGVNALNQLGLGPSVLRDGALTLGALTTLIGATRLYLNLKHNSNIDNARAEIYYVEKSRMDAYLPHRLEQNELFALYEENREVRIYYYETEFTKGPWPSSLSIKIGQGVSPKSTLDKWLQDPENAKYIQNRSFIDIDKLSEHIRLFEESKSTE